MKKKIFFNYSGRQIYVDLITKLDEGGICEPSLLIGDDRLFKQLNKIYNGSVVTQKSLFHDIHSLALNTSQIKNYDFFLSSEYQTCKDQCLKMMDRVDDLGLFCRLDRESLVHRLIVYWIEKLEKFTPDAVVFCDAPHTHETYVLYMLSIYKSIPVCILKQWGIAPCMYAQIHIGEQTKKLSRGSIQYSSDNSVLNYIISYIERVLESANETHYEPLYMYSQRLSSSLFGKYYKFIGNQKRRYKAGVLTKAKLVRGMPKFIFRSLRDAFAKLFSIPSKIFLYYYRDYDPKTPYLYLSIMNSVGVRSRRRRLESRYNELVTVRQDADLNRKYVYYPLHYEPEASTNPEGGLFHDQFLVLTALKRWLPSDVVILVKEHPSQFYKADTFGYRGRSCFFYDSILDLGGVHLVSKEVSSLKLISNSQFVVTVTGTAAIEAVILGKQAVYFGDPWYAGAPATHRWKPDINYASIVQLKSSGAHIQKFLANLYELHAFPALLNPSGIDLYPEFETSQYLLQELGCLKDIVVKFLKGLESD